MRGTCTHDIGSQVQPGPGSVRISFCLSSFFQSYKNVFKKADFWKMLMNQIGQIRPTLCVCVCVRVFVCFCDT